MNLEEKGWFNKIIASQVENGKKTGQVAKDQFIYKSTHKTGLIYGHPVLPKEYKTAEFLELPSQDKLKIVLLDGFIKTAVLPSEEHIPDNPDEFIHNLSESIIEYYSNVNPYKKVKDRNFWGKKLSNEEIVEALLNERLDVDEAISENFWLSFFNNSLLFLDVFFFGEWLANRKEETTIAHIKEQRDNIHLLLLQVMASASYADSSLQDEEKMLFDQFLKSAHLPENLEEKARGYIRTGVKIDEINLSAAKTWLLKKYILELAILTVWADKIVTEDEKSFIRIISDNLGFSRDELETSMIAVESFVLSNWGNIPFLQAKNSFEDIRTRFLDRITKVVDKNKTRISEEIHESKELMELLVKSSKTELTDEEQIKVRTQLIDILKLLPTFVIIALPGSFLTLPLLLKILPKSALPNAFNKD